MYDVIQNAHTQGTKHLGYKGTFKKVLIPYLFIKIFDKMTKWSKWSLNQASPFKAHHPIEQVNSDVFFDLCKTHISAN